MDGLLTLGIIVAVIVGGTALAIWCDRADEHDRRTATQARILADAQAVATAADEALAQEEEDEGDLMVSEMMRVAARAWYGNDESGVQM